MSGQHHDFDAQVLAAIENGTGWQNTAAVLCVHFDDQTPGGRIIDKALQRLRKAGRIRYVTGVPGVRPHWKAAS